MHSSNRATLMPVIWCLLPAGTAFADSPDLAIGTIVSLNAQAHTLTLKGAHGRISTTQVEGAALAGFHGLEPGEKVFATLLDTPDGERAANTTVAVLKTDKVFTVK